MYIIRAFTRVWLVVVAADSSPFGASLLTKREHLSKSPILWATFDV